MQTFYFTDPGKVRSHNEDSVTILSNDKKEFILAIADGMGGHKAGEVASKIAIDYITTAFYKKETIGSKDEAIEWLRTIVKEINNKINFSNRNMKILKYNSCNNINASSIKSLLINNTLTNSSN